MVMRKNSKSFCRMDQLELRRLLSTIYVDGIAPGTTHDGSSWANAYIDLQQALSAATPGAVIEVAAGTYKPTTGSDRSATFQLIDGVTIDGGYAGYGQSNPDARDPALYPTILSGDIGTAGDNFDNSDHVVTASNTDSTAILDGVTITDGNADQTNSKGGGIYDNSGAATINDCIITGNTAFIGGGIYENDASLTLTNCTLTGNSATNGGAIDTSNSATTLTDCIISGNSASSGAGISDESEAATLINTVLSGNQAAQAGGAMYNYACSPSLTNCTISGNTAVQGGGIFNTGPNGNPSSPALVNCILWGDTATNGNEIYNSSGSSATITYSDIDQSSFTATGDIDANPIFVRNPGTNGSTDYGDLHLQGASPAINVGSNAAISGTTTDLDGNPRIVNGTVDMGAFESPADKLVIVTAPAASTAAGNAVSIVVDTEDQNGNIITGDDSNVVANIVTGPTGASLGGVSTVADQSGQATFNDLILTKAGTYTIAFSQSSVAGATTNTFTITAGAPASLTITQQPTNTTAGQAISPVIVQVKDQYGNLADGSSVSIAVATGPSNPSLGGTTTLATSGGIATFSNLSLDQAGSYTLAFTDGSIPSVTSSSFTITPGAASKLVFVVQPTDTVAGQAIPAFTVQSEDAFGNLRSTDQTSVTVTSNPAGTTATADESNGIASFSSVSITTAGTYTFVATAGTLTSATSDSFNITAAAPASLSISQQPTNGIAGQAISPVAVQVKDQYGNLVDGSNVTLAVSSGPSATLGGSLTASTVDGVATFNNLTLDRAGTFALAATDGSLPAATTNTFAISYAGPQLVFSTEPANAAAGAKLPAFTVETVDTTGTLVTTGKSKILLTLSSGGKLIGTANATVKNGEATFSKLSIQKAGTYTITATDSAFASAISTNFTITAAAPAKLLFDPQPASVTPGTPFNVQVELLDRYGNLAGDGSTATLTLGSHPSAASLSSSAVVSNGLADFDALTLDTAGNYTLKAIDGKPKATSKKFVVS
jgi:hypothetical protein